MERRPPETLQGVESAPSRGWGRTFASLSNRQFRLLWIGSLLSFSAMQMNMVAKPWLAYELSASALVLGLVAAAQGLPMLLVAPFGGLAADRLSKRTVLLVSQSIILAMSAVMALLIFLDLVQVWHLVVLSLVQGCVVPFNQPVRQSYIPVLVHKRDMPNAIALQSSARNMDQVVAPSIAGLLLSIDPALTFVVIVAFHFGAMVVSLRLPVGTPQVKKSRGVVGELLFGFRYVLTTSYLRILIGMALLAIILGRSFQHLLPVYQDILDIGPGLLGLMYTTLGVGALLGSLTVASFSHLATRGYPQLIAGVAFGIALAAFALSPVYQLSLPLLFCLGLASQSYMTMNQTRLLTYSDPALYGRVTSVMMMTHSFMPIMVLPMGALVDAFGAPYTLAVSGGLLVVGIVTLGAWIPSLRYGDKT